MRKENNTKVLWEGNLNKKPTRTTFKSFLKHGYGKLSIRNLSSFNGMVDCVMPTDNQGWQKLTPKDDLKYLSIHEIMSSHDSTLGFNGIWLTNGSGRSKDWFSWYQKDDCVGIEVSNCVGNFIIGWRGE